MLSVARDRRLVSMAIVFLTVGCGAHVGGSSDKSSALSAGPKPTQRESANWIISCEDRGCHWYGIPETSLRFTTSQDSDIVDVTMTVSLGFRLSKGDAASLRGTYVPIHTPPSPSPYIRMKPGSYRVGPQGADSSTTLVWFARDLPARGRMYEFKLEGKLHPDQPTRESRLVGGPSVTIVETSL